MKKIILIGIILYHFPTYSQTYYPQPSGWNYQSPSRNYYTPQQTTQKPKSNCSGSEVSLGALAGSGISAAISNKNSYGWAIPLGAFLGAGLGRLTCR